MLLDLSIRSLRSNPLSRKLHTWLEWSSGHHDSEFVFNTLLHGVPVLPLGYRPPPNPEQANYKSMFAPGAIRSVHEQLKAEVEQGVLLRFKPQHFQALEPHAFFNHIHPMGAVPKWEGTVQTGWRIIQDYSSPKDHSINDRIDYMSMSFDKMDGPLSYVSKWPGCFLAKIDIKGFFRHVPVDPMEWPLLVARWDFDYIESNLRRGITNFTSPVAGQGDILVDTRVPFGLRHAPEVCCRLAKVVIFILDQRLQAMGIHTGVHVYVTNVVDDFLVISPRHHICLCVWLLLCDILTRLGFTLSSKKLQPPTHIIKWLGLLIDSTRQRALLPQSKIQKCLALLKSLRDRPSRKATRKELDSLLGYLSFCCSVVYGGRAFMHSMRSLRHKEGCALLRHVSDRIHLNKPFLADVQWWIDNLVRFNGEIPIVEAQAQHDVRLDATGKGGIGVFVDGGFLSFSPGQQHTLLRGHPTTEFANEWELFAFAVLLRAFGPYLANHHVLVLSDNYVAVQAVRRFHIPSMHSEYLAAVLREIFSLCVQHNIRLKPRWIPGTTNSLADALSRQKWEIAGSEISAYAYGVTGRASAFAMHL